MTMYRATVNFTSGGGLVLDFPGKNSFVGAIEDILDEADVKPFSSMTIEILPPELQESVVAKSKRTDTPPPEYRCTCPVPLPGERARVAEECGWCKARRG